jgi:hypothetical protein
LVWGAASPTRTKLPGALTALSWLAHVWGGLVLGLPVVNFDFSGIGQSEHRTGQNETEGGQRCANLPKVGGGAP